MPGPVGIRDQDPPSHTPAPTRDCQGGLCKLPGQRGNSTQATFGPTPTPWE